MACVLMAHEPRQKSVWLLSLLALGCQILKTQPRTNNAKMQALRNSSSVEGQTANALRTEVNV